MNISDYPTLTNCLFGVVKLTKNADFDKHGYILDLGLDMIDMEAFHLLVLY